MSINAKTFSDKKTLLICNVRNDIFCSTARWGPLLRLDPHQIFSEIQGTSYNTKHITDELRNGKKNQKI